MDVRGHKQTLPARCPGVAWAILRVWITVLLMKFIRYPVVWSPLMKKQMLLYKIILKRAFIRMAGDCENFQTRNKEL